MDHISSCIC